MGRRRTRMVSGELTLSRFRVAPSEDKDQVAYVTESESTPLLFHHGLLDQFAIRDVDSETAPADIVVFSDQRAVDLIP